MERACPLLQLQSGPHHATFPSFWPSLRYSKTLCKQSAELVPGSFRSSILLPAQRLAARSQADLSEPYT